jgi:hypothetical protein
MALNPNDREAAKAKTDRTAEELGRKVVRLLRRGKPHAEKAAKDALRYAQDHEDEIKRAAVKGARMRMPGLGLIIDAMQREANQAAQRRTCPACGTASQPKARFCTECGAQLPGAVS